MTLLKKISDMKKNLGRPFCQEQSRFWDFSLVGNNKLACRSFMDTGRKYKMFWPDNNLLFTSIALASLIHGFYRVTWNRQDNAFTYTLLLQYINWMFRKPTYFIMGSKLAWPLLWDVNFIILDSKNTWFFLFPSCSLHKYPLKESRAKSQLHSS